MRRLTITLLLVEAALAMCLGQGFNLGTPPVNSFSNKTYKGGTQNWDIGQDSRGIIFIANNEGLMEFDGSHWRKHPIGNGTIVRSVLVGSHGKIYVGGQGDFGFFFPNEKGVLTYKSWSKNLSMDAHSFSDIWDILEQPNGVFFRSDRQVFLYIEDSLQIFEFDTPLRFMGLLSGQVFLQSIEGDFFVFENQKFKPLTQKLDETTFVSSSLAYHPDTTLLVTIHHGIYYFTKNKFGRWATPVDEMLKAGRLYCANLLPNGMIALGTTNNGLIVLDRKRQIHQHLTKKNGLQNNTVLSLFTDRAGDLWLGLDNGVDHVEASSPFSSIFPDGEVEGTGYALEVFEEKLFFGTNTGLYAIPLQVQYSPAEKSKFELVPGTEGQVWSLQVLEDELLIGHHEGAFSLKGGLVRKLTDFQGVWRFLYLAPGQAIAGCYEGLARFEKVGGRWVFQKKLIGLDESSRLLAHADDGGLWMAHPYRGIFKVNFDHVGSVKVKFFDSNAGLPSNFNNLVFELQNRVVFAGATGIFDFDDSSNSFVDERSFNDFFKDKTRVKYLRQDAADNIWYIADEEVGLLQVEDNAIEKKVVKRPIPELADRPTDGFEFIFTQDNQNVFFATDKGFVHFDPTRYQYLDSQLAIVLQEVRLQSGFDSLLFGGHPPTSGQLALTTLPSNLNTLTFLFSATDHQGSEFVMYSHFLEGSDIGWSDWHSNDQLIFNNLPPGSYIFQVKARNKFGQESDPVSFAFEISPPWYGSQWAKLIYIFTLLGGFLGYVLFQRKRFEKEKAAMESSYQQVQAEQQQLVMRSEEIIDRLEREKLEAEVRLKNQELAATTMNLVQKSEVINAIQEFLEGMKKQSTLPPETKKEITGLIRMMDSDTSRNEEWEQFSRHFDQVHDNFLKRLGEAYPDLSPNDFKLSTYLRMNLASKEIASLMNISVRGVEASRYRLRKRLNLPSGTNLTEFLMKL